MALSEENILIIKGKAREAGDFLVKNNVTDLPAQNPYSYIWSMVNQQLGRNYKDCEDDDLDYILEIIEEYKNDAL